MRDNFKSTAIGMVVGTVLINIVFWLALIGGGLWLLQHFGAI